MSERNSHRARVAALTRSRAADDPALIEARRALVETGLAEHIVKVVAGAPRLTETQLDRLASLLRPVASVGGEAA